MLYGHYAARRPRLGVGLGSLVGAVSSPVYVWAASGAASIHMAELLARVGIAGAPGLAEELRADLEARRANKRQRPQAVKEDVDLATAPSG